MMNRRFLAIFILLITKTVLSQKPAIEAVYFDSNQIPYKIERKYLDSNCETYVVHNNETSFCVKRWTYQKGDTIIRKEASYSMVVPKLKSDRFLHCDYTVVSRQIKGDTIWLEGYRKDSTGNLAVFCDSVLTGETKNFNSEEFLENVKRSRVPSIISGDLAIKPDSLVLEETMLAYFVNRIPVKVEFIYDGKCKDRIISKRYENKIVYRHYYEKQPDANPYEVDTILWNADKTEIIMLTTRFDWKKSFVSKYHVRGKKLQSNYGTQWAKEIEFLDNKNIFQNLLISEVVYDDVLYTVELRLFDREKILYMKSDGKETNNIYTFDGKKRVVEQFTYVNDELQKRITYAY